MGDNIKGYPLINSIIGEGARFRGDLDIHGLLRIDGDFEGSIRTDGRVLVGRHGRARCVIHSETVIVGGVIKGDIWASHKVVVLSTGMIIGNIRAPHLIVEEGVIIHGHCTITEDSQMLAKAPSGDESLFSIDWGGGKLQTQSSGS